ncbi:hypothetical protein ADK67_41870 [Saccharothrix sp. NRRL B-16348]|uniref:hypothetical protein n=1 Tax=Saccharothrix sp. NRRL B-16348 TaxID=1415542 RepID=UPI0006AE571C|nr:hypothetical protein [Saccharothrix sp. NRRL B-16348]KOX15218.1 hypothetical protein ADK67_41870 [Saccharothrix sp. NRRL B-16348]
MDVSPAIPGIVSATPLGGSVAAGLVMPAVITAPFTMVLALAVWGFFGATAVWYTVLVLAGMLVVLGLVLSVFLVVHEFGSVHWVALRPREAPEFLLVKRIFGETRVPMGEVRRVTVLHRVKMGKPNGVDVVFHTATGEINCPRVDDTANLAEWLRDVLVGVEVERTRTVDRLHPTRDQWWPYARVAAEWGVPVEAVGALIDHLGVRSHFLIPRVGAMHGVNQGVNLYDPDDVREITDQLAQPSAERRVAALMLQRLTSLAENAAEDKSSEVLGEVMPDAELARRYRAALALTSLEEPDAYVAHAQYSLCQAVRGEPLPPEGAEVPSDFATVLAETLATAPVLRTTRLG